MDPTSTDREEGVVRSPSSTAGFCRAKPQLCLSVASSAKCVVMAITLVKHLCPWHLMSLVAVLPCLGSHRFLHTAGAPHVIPPWNGDQLKADLWIKAWVKGLSASLQSQTFTHSPQTCDYSPVCSHL